MGSEVIFGGDFCAGIKLLCTSGNHILMIRGS